MTTLTFLLIGHAAHYRPEDGPAMSVHAYPYILLEVIACIDGTSLFISAAKRTGVESVHICGGFCFRFTYFFLAIG